MKPVPVIVNACEAVPAVKNAGDRLVIVGEGLTAVTAKLAVAVPPPGAGFATATGKVPAVARSAVVRGIVSWAELTNVAW